MRKLDYLNTRGSVIQKIIGFFVFRLRMYRVVWEIASRVNDRRFVLSYDLKEEADSVYEISGKKVAQELMDYIRKDFVVLDFGIGSGRVEKYLATECKEIHEFDISQGMLNKDKQRLRNFPHIYLHKTARNSLKFPSENFFDFAFSVGTLQHLHPDDAKMVLSEICVTLNPGSRAYLQFMKGGIPTVRPNTAEIAMKEVRSAGFEIECANEDKNSVVIVEKNLSNC